MLLPLGRHHWFGADKLDDPLRHPPQVDVKTYWGVSRDCPSRQPLRRMEQRRQARVNQQAVNARGSSSLWAVVRAEGVPPHGGRQLEVRILQPASPEGRQGKRRCSKRAVQVKVEVAPHQLRGRSVSRHMLRGVVPERAVEGRLGRDTVHHLGVQGICPRAQANQEVPPAGGVLEGLGEGVRRGGGGLVTVPATPGARGSRSAEAGAPPVVPPIPHCSVGPRATARAGPRPSAIASPRGGLVGCGRIDTLQPGRGSGHWGHSRRGAAGAGTLAVPTTTRAERVQSGTGATWLAAAPVPVSPLALVSCGGWPSCG